MKFQVCISFALLFSSALAIAERLGCRDEEGNLVDWFYIYKLPNSFGDNEIDSKSSGLNYLFITPDSSDWILSKLLINDSMSMPGKTLSPMYEDHKDNDLVMMYNDEPTNGPPEGNRGHTKGVVVANDINGFWLIHSVPKFPPTLEDGHYDYPKTGTIYGQ